MTICSPVLAITISLSLDCKATFSRFPKLPLELQLEVWKAAIVPRFIQITISDKNIITAITKPEPHPFLSTCRNSRDVYLEKHETLLAENWKLYVDFTRDVFYFNSYVSGRHKALSSVQWAAVGSMGFSRIRRLRNSILALPQLREIDVILDGELLQRPPAPTSAFMRHALEHSHPCDKHVKHKTDQWRYDDGFHSSNLRKCPACAWKRYMKSQLKVDIDKIRYGFEARLDRTLQRFYIE